MPSWRELKRFCERDGWELYKDTDHYFYRKRDPGGNIRRTKISKGTGEIKSRLWQDILKRQLQVSKEYFNAKL
ncbi:MAG: type II toxin-antitoxin system HicA family toxin [Oscillospiraceae bacterium]|nr:type II toxin-antitoxin system HicA family toxin [Oscillospiraceae bacterium]